MKCKITNGLCSYIHCPIYNHPEVYLNFKAECKNRESIDSDTKRTCDETCPHCDPDNEICTKHQMGISPYEECLDYHIESSDKHRKQST